MQVYNGCKYQFIMKTETIWHYLLPKSAPQNIAKQILNRCKIPVYKENG